MVASFLELPYAVDRNPLQLGFASRMPSRAAAWIACQIVEVVIDPKVAFALVPNARDIFDAFDKLGLDCVSCYADNFMSLSAAKNMSMNGE